MYYSAIGVLAVMVLLIENEDLLQNRKGAFEKTAWKVYRRFLFAVLTYYVTDVLWGMLESRKLSYLLFADTTVYFAAMAAGVLFWAEFTVAYLEESNAFAQFLVSSCRFVAALITILTILNISMPVLFTVDGDCVYRALPLRYAMLIVQIALLLLISAYAYYSLRSRRAERERRYRALGLFGLIMAAFLFVQLWFPYLPLYSIAYLLGTCLLHAYVVIDEKEAYKRDLAEADKVRELKDTIVSLLDNMPAMTFTKDAKTGVYLACNQAFANYAHKDSPAAVVGLTDAQIFDAETARHFMADDRVALSMDEPYIFHEEVLDAAGNPRQFHTTKRKYCNVSGALCVLGICQDMTDMVRVQLESAKNREAYEKARSGSIIYTRIAQALARGYTDLYYINLDTEEFIKYRNDDDTGTLIEARRDWHFFEECRLTAEELVYPDDRAAVIRALDRKTLVAELDRSKTFVMTYRLLTEDGPKYVSARVSRLEDDDRYIILGVSDVDEQMKQRRAALQAKEEQIASARLNALSGDYLCVYVVDPESGGYREFSANRRYESFALPKEGADFFGTSRESARRFVHPDDQNRFLSVFTGAFIMAEVERRGIFTMQYRLMMEGAPVYVQLKAAMAEEKEGPRLIVGINDVDDQVRLEDEYAKTLAQARMSANIDALTGVKNRHAYREAEEQLNHKLAQHPESEFAVVILDVNDLKKVNDTDGHKAGDQHLRDACKIVCDVFCHSPVFRVGGDEFAVIAQGGDYARIDELIGLMRAHNEGALQNGGIVIACGMARREGERSVASVFERADRNMYKDKSGLKSRRP